MAKNAFYQDVLMPPRASRNQLLPGASRTDRAHQPPATLGVPTGALATTGGLNHPTKAQREETDEKVEDQADEGEDQAGNGGAFVSGTVVSL